jgi:multidrug efflux system membrane fusion protein
MNRKTIVLAALPPAVLAIAGALYFTLAPAFEKGVVVPVAPAPVPVVAGVVSGHEVPLYLRGVGTVIGYNTDVVRSQIQGQLTQIAFTEGQTVKAGDLLAQIDPRPYQAQLDQMIANRDRDQAQLANAIANLGRYTELQNKGYATPQLSDTQKAQVAQLQSAIKADEALIEQAEVQLSYTRLTSPIPGITGVRQIDVGNIIHPTDPNGLVVVAQVEPISLIFTLPQSELPRIQAQMAKGPLTVIAYSQDDKIKLDEASSCWSSIRLPRRRARFSSRRLFPTRRTACGRASWSTPGCSSTRDRTD